MSPLVLDQPSRRTAIALVLEVVAEHAARDDVHFRRRSTPGREVMEWARGGRVLRVSLLVGSTVVERIEAGARTIYHGVAPGKPSRDGRPLDLLSLVHGGWAWLCEEGGA